MLAGILMGPHFFLYGGALGTHINMVITPFLLQLNTCMGSIQTIGFNRLLGPLLFEGSYLSILGFKVFGEFFSLEPISLPGNLGLNTGEGLFCDCCQAMEFPSIGYQGVPSTYPSTSRQRYSFSGWLLICQVEMGTNC